MMHNTKKTKTRHLVKPTKSDLDQPMKILHTFLDYTGDLSELNIWGKALPEEEMINMTQNCGKVHPQPDILNWSEIENSIEELTGKNHTKPVERLCNSYGNGAKRQVVPIRCSTCPLVFGCWELSHVIFLMLRMKKNCLQR